MSTSQINPNSPKQNYRQQPPPVHQCQCNRSSFGLHLFILFALIGSAGFFLAQYRGDRSRATKRYTAPKRPFVNFRFA